MPRWSNSLNMKELLPITWESLKAAIIELTSPHNDWGRRGCRWGQREMRGTATQPRACGSGGHQRVEVLWLLSAGTLRGRQSPCEEETHPFPSKWWYFLGKEGSVPSSSGQQEADHNLRGGPPEQYPPPGAHSLWWETQGKRIRCGAGAGRVI